MSRSRSLVTLLFLWIILGTISARRSHHQHDDNDDDDDDDDDDKDCDEDKDCEESIDIEIKKKVEMKIHVKGDSGSLNGFGGSSIQCGDYVCHGHSPYCCTLDDGELGCCWDTFVYQLWWFWLIWVVVFFMILGCSLACWRRRRQHVRYVVMANSEYPSYGTVVHGASTHTAYQTGPMPPPPTAPAAPPSYANKPPPYSYSG